ncbi:AAA family ATPase [Desulfonema magnum]|uniref:AAA ATPase-like domain-containing protein n=1 Tax=Desulfonema magnum TaxID=45655 RepID=A0A975GQK1_9BACT|nr:AAA family ATPase [Desulfonema magnum]QTA89985.1 AAA ATPase-like domain-containing protein [Desulfonema magnum]
MKLKKLLSRRKKSLWENRSAIPIENPAASSDPGFAEVDLKKAGENRCVCIFPYAKETDFYRVLREQIQQRTREKDWNTLMITSAHPGEGKTLTAINLAVTFAKAFDGNALLADCDLKHQNIQHYMGFPSKRGLADYLLDNRPLKDIIIRPDVEKLSVISGGRMIQDSSELLGSQKMKTLVAEMKSRYEDRYIFLDVPHILGKADAIALAPLADCILMVVQAGRTSVHDVRKALELIPKDKFLGFILNQM